MSTFKTIFNNKLDEFLKANSDRSGIMNDERYELLIEEIEEARRIKKNRKKTLSSRQYRILKRYDICEVEGTKKLVEKTENDKQNTKKNRFFCKAGEVFDVLESVHYNLGHKSTRVNFDHFQILRAIGKGSFGKVCIVQKRDSGILYAMKYVSRGACENRGALGGVIKEVELLSSLEHPFLVNLWFSFQDEEDLFMVSDLLTGGDLRYHLQQRVEFSEESVALLICELGSALEYLQKQRVVHRDIKPDNILLDDAGHAHLTDFNIATKLQKDGMACSMSGTKPYMAPEVFMCALDEIAGYSFPVDWWSLGVVAFEMRSGSRPFIVHSNTPLTEVKNILHSSLHYPRHWNSSLVDLLTKLLCVHPGGRISSQQELQQTPLLRQIDFKRILEKKAKPPFKPPEDHLNCDPCLELEEMIVETRPLHKKKKRLAKQRSAQRDSDPETILVKEFIVYNRYKELKRKAMEKKENDWQKELELAMANSIVNSLAPIKEREVPCCSKEQSDSIDYIDRTPSPKSSSKP